LLQLLTSTRSGEVVNAEWSEIDLQAGVWRQPGSKTKNKREHRVMLPREAVELLQARRDLHMRWAFPSFDDKPLLQKAVGFAQYELRQNCPVKDWVVHDLRRTTIAGLAILGCPRVVQDRIANHFNGGVAEIYDRHTYDAEARMWLQRWADRLGELGLRLRETVILTGRSRTAVGAEKRERTSAIEFGAVGDGLRDG
jgi:integrase